MFNSSKTLSTKELESLVVVASTYEGFQEMEAKKNKIDWLK